MKLSLKVLALALLAVLSCGQPPTPSVDSGKLGPTADPLPIAEHPEVGGVTLVHGDFTPEEWAFATAPRPATNPRANKDTRSLADFKRDACTGAPTAAHPEGEWRCKGPRPTVFAATSGSTPVLPVSWRVPTWYFDNANSSGTASDTNDCVTSVTPCATWGEIWVHRLGAGAPQLQQATTFNQLSAQTLNVDNIYGTFQGANGSQAILKGALTQVCTIAINVATVTAQVRGGPGTRWQVSNACTGEVAKTLLQDTTQNTWSTVDSVGAGTATISQPVINATLTTVGIPTLTAGSMATNDAFTVWAQPLSNLKVWRMMGGDVGAGGANTVANAAWVQDVEIADSSGTGASQFPLESDGAITVLSRVRVDPRLHISVLNGRGNGYYLMTVDVTPATVQFAGGAGAMFADVFRGGVTWSGGSQPTVSGDTVLHGSSATNGGQPTLTNVFSDGTLTIQNAMANVQGVLWGSASVSVNTGGTYWKNTGSTFATTLLTSGALTLGAAAQTTGFTSLRTGTFTLNGITQVDTAGNFPANATITWSLNTVGGTPGIGSPYFSAANTAGHFFVKSLTAGANDVYNWEAQPALLTITPANLDTFGTLLLTSSRFTDGNQ